MELCYKTFVSVGNCKQAFTRLLDAVKSQAACLPKPILVQHGHTPFFSEECHGIDFVNMDTFTQHIDDAEVLIFHGGAGSIHHALRKGKCPIVMPRRAEFGEHVNNHQVTFGSTLYSCGKVLLVDNVDELSIAIHKVQAAALKIVPHGNQSLALETIKKRLNLLLGASTKIVDPEYSITGVPANPNCHSRESGNL
ncbi:MAG TPA: glycosyltransferase [Gammaproteobacteria bacterium]|nr:MAG: hypothetical protein A3E83_06785 [Gammaproteobacteria bacterium RIFCSPHIGHO2_12_FULL_41_20]HLB43534.1 glycosyltransferase [Gammaproteobacteria bacterium]